MQQTILMCAPDFFGVDYVINPWMSGNVGQSNHALAVQQWNALHALIAHYADIKLVPPEKGLPDIVFTANAGLVWGNRVIVSRFRSPERQGETAPYTAWFAAHGFDVVEWPEDVTFEGAGDALFDRGHPKRLWLAHGFRSDPRAETLLAEKTGCEIVTLRLIDPSFYHLDTCLCPLSGGRVMYYPGAFDAAGNATIERLVPADKRIVVNAEDAASFVCNAVELEHHLFVNAASDELQTRLKAQGFTPVVTPLTEFMKAGGSAKCLTLKLVEAIA